MALNKKMSEASITYRGEGERCGIFNVLNSELKNHEVCDDGLACLYTDLGDNVERKTCKSVEVIEGDRCVPQYDMCYSNLQCLKNVDGYFTCGGTVPWTSNPDYIKTGYLKASDYCINIPLIVVGVCILFFYFIMLFYEFFVNYDNGGEKVKSIYSNRFDNGNRRNGWIVNIFRQVFNADRRWYN